ncbi:hypothetical protein QBC39DRAFT_46786 [Podospora conica]|nr:hypothetical protein QBC39DRAFT_46786 [Schizothecium conicum]
MLRCYMYIQPVPRGRLTDMPPTPPPSQPKDTPTLPTTTAITTTYSHTPTMHPLTIPSPNLTLLLHLLLPLLVSPAPTSNLQLPTWDDPRLASHIDAFQKAAGSNTSPFNQPSGGGISNNFPDLSDLLPAGANNKPLRWKQPLPPLAPIPTPVTAAYHGDEWYFPDDERDDADEKMVVKARGEGEWVGPRPRPTEAPARPMPKRVEELKVTVVVERPKTMSTKDAGRSTLGMEVVGRRE